MTHGAVGIGWPEVGDLTTASSADDIRIRLNAAYTDAKPSTIANWAGQIDAFRFRIQVGDLVALPLKSTPAIAFGQITGGYSYHPDAVDALRHQRTVDWITEGVARDAIDQDLLYSFGAFLTVCQISRNEAEQRITTLLEAPASTASPATIPATSPATAPADMAAGEPTEATNPPVDLGELGRDLIRRHLARRFTSHDLARLVSALLRADGFVCETSQAGPDGGVDVLAGEGDMGFDGAMMAVQVKSGGIIVDAPTLRELKGVMGNFGANRGLFVSWGGFTKAARQEARRLFFEIRLWDSDAVIDKLQILYDRLPADIKAEIPLQQVWTLLPDDS